MNTTLCRLIICSCAFLSACIDPVKPDLPDKPKSRDQAAGVLISVNSVTPWSEVAAALQPNFTITGDSALAQVAPTTARINEQVLKAFGLNAGIGLPQTSTQTSNKTTTQGSPETGTTTTVDNSTTDSTQPGSAPQVPTGTPAGAQALTHPAAANGNIDIDPLLKYQAALSLYQAVTLMNQKLHSVASGKCYTPYLVQMKIAIMPYRQHLPFDLHSTISFFPNINNSGSPFAYQVPEAPYPLKSLPLKPVPEECSDAAPRVVPVLITDDIEKAVRQNAMETARQIGFAVSGLLGGIGANLGTNQLNQSLKDMLGQDISSRFTVARLVDNTLYVRVGAANQANAAKSLVGQTYDIALILLVPAHYDDSLKIGNSKIIQVVTTSEFRDAETGNILSDASTDTLLAADKVFHDMGTPRLTNAWDAQDAAQKMNVIHRLLPSVSTGNYLYPIGPCAAPGQVDTNFVCALENTELSLKKNGKKEKLSELIPKAYYPLLWSKLTPLLVDSPFKTASFELPATPVINVTPDKQTILLEDDTKKTTSATLRGISVSAPSLITASLALHDPDRKRDYTLLATSASINQNGGVLTLGFPSLAKLGIANFEPGKSRLVIEPSNCTSANCPSIAYNKPNLSFPVLYIADGTEVGKPSFNFSSKQSAIIADGGKATAIVQLSKMKCDSVEISSASADIESATDSNGKPLKVTDGKIKVTGPLKAIIRLSGVTTGMLVDITATGVKKGKGSVIHPLYFVTVSK